MIGHKSMSREINIFRSCKDVKNELGGKYISENELHDECTRLYFTSVPKASSILPHFFTSGIPCIIFKLTEMSWDAHSKSYDVFFTPILQKFCKTALLLLGTQKFANVIHIAAGSGAMTQLLIEPEFGDVNAVDYSKSMLELVSARLPPVTFVIVENG